MIVIMLLNVKMQIVVGIITFISRIITTYESFKVIHVLMFWYLSFYEELKFHAKFS